MRWGEVLATITCLVLMVVIITNTGVRYAVACMEDAKNGPITYGRSSDSLGRRVAVAPVAVGARRRWLARAPYVPPTCRPSFATKLEPKSSMLVVRGR